MRYFFLIAVIWNLWGGLNFLFFPGITGKKPELPIGTCSFIIGNFLKR
jgi:hypothetical protein